jgi:hypothetical protein
MPAITLHGRGTDLPGGPGPVNVTELSEAGRAVDPQERVADLIATYSSPTANCWKFELGHRRPIVNDRRTVFRRMSHVEPSDH